MGWRKDWGFLNIQIPPILNAKMVAVHRKTGRSRAAQAREALMSFYGIDDISAAYTKEGRSPVCMPENCEIKGGRRECYECSARIE